MNLTYSQRIQALGMAADQGKSPGDIVQEALDFLALKEELGTADFARLMQSYAEAEQEEFVAITEVESALKLALKGS